MRCTIYWIFCVSAEGIARDKIETAMWILYVDYPELASDTLTTLNPPRQSNTAGRSQRPEKTHKTQNRKIHNPMPVVSETNVFDARATLLPVCARSGRWLCSEWDQRRQDETTKPAFSVSGEPWEKVQPRTLATHCATFKRPFRWTMKKS